MRTIHQGNEYMNLLDDGRISRPAINMAASGNWRVTGAVRYNNFGNAVEHFTLVDVLTKKLQWTYKNGQQRIHICDLDYGTHRVWMSPKHQVY